MFDSVIILASIVCSTVLIYLGASFLTVKELYNRYRKTLESENRQLARKAGEKYYTAIKKDRLSTFDYKLIEEDIKCRSMSDYHKTIIHSHKVESAKAF